MRNTEMKALGLLVILALAGCPSGGGGGGGGGSGGGGGGTGGTGGGTDAGASCADLSGPWTLSVSADGTQCSFYGSVYQETHTLDVTQTGCDLTIDVDGQGTLQGHVDGSQVTWSGTMPYYEGMSVTVTSTDLSVSGGHLTGTVTFGATQSGVGPCPYVWTIDGTRTGGGGSDGGGGGGGSDGGTPLGVAQEAVGGWAASGSCGSTTLSYGWFVCPGGRLRGYHTINGYDFLDCGTWSVSDPSTISVDVTDTATADGSTGHNTYPVGYDSANDQLDLPLAVCRVPLHRLTGSQVTEADCQSSTCSAGGSGAVQCGTDCDCGRCWYCDQGTCRYGGEGPYGCYRGCGG